MGRVIYSYMTTHTLLPNIVTVHKWVEIEMADKSKPPHTLTDLCREFMWLTPPPSSNKSSLLFDAIIPVIPGHQNESAAVTYRPYNEEAAALIKKIRRSPPAWFLG
jgi:hypothetical protein